MADFMEENRTTQENTVPETTENSGLMELAMKAGIGIAGLFTAYKVGKTKGEKSKEEKPKRKLKFQSPIKFVEVEAKEGGEEKPEEKKPEETKKK